MASVFKKAGSTATEAGAVGASAVSGVPQFPEPATYSYDPGPSGGYVVSGPAPAPYDPYSDPAYLAFLAALDQQQSTYSADLLARQGEVDRQLNEALPRIAQAGTESRRRISSGFESRGTFRSGERLRNIALQQQGEAQQVGDTQSAAARQKSALQSAYNQQIADLARQRAEKAFELGASAA